jgi:hypothetical protein
MSDFTLEISDVTTTLEIETSTEDNTENLEVTSTVIGTVEIQTGYSSTVAYASDIIGLSNYIADYKPVALSGMQSIAGTETSNPVYIYHSVIDGGSP